MRKAADCPDCGNARMFVGFEAHIEEHREHVRIFVCRACHVMEKVLVTDKGAHIIERRGEIRPPQQTLKANVPEPA